MSIYPIHTLSPGDRIKVTYLHSSANCDSLRTDVVTVKSVEGEFVHGEDGCRYHQYTVSGLVATEAEDSERLRGLATRASVTDARLGSLLNGLADAYTAPSPDA